MIINMIEILIAHRGKEIEGEYIGDGMGDAIEGVDEDEDEDETVGDRKGKGECVHMSCLLQERSVDVLRD